MLQFLRTKILKMAPHADLIPDLHKDAAAPGAKLTAQNLGGKASIEATLSTTPIRDSLSPLFEDNIAAKIIKTGINSLANNVSPPGENIEFRAPSDPN